MKNNQIVKCFNFMRSQADLDKQINQWLSENPEYEIQLMNLTEANYGTTIYIVFRLRGENDD